MAIEPARFRPKAYPPPEFPPRRLPVFAKVPPAIFPVLLGILGLAMALRLGLDRLGLPAGVGDLVAGLALGFWVFGAVAYGTKLARRPGVLLEDLKVMPARSGLAAGTAGLLAAAGLLAPFAPGFAVAVLSVGLGLHLALALCVLWVLARMPAETRVVNPGWHLIFTGFIIGAPSAALLGQMELARGLIWLTLPIAAAIWGVSLAQLIRGFPPAPLRPMLAIHLAPASLFATSAALTGMEGMALGFAIAALGLAALMALLSGWLTAAGFSPLWGAFTFPMAAVATAMLRQGGPLSSLGVGLLAVALVVVPWIAWKVLKLWPGGQLASKTNTATA
ncbi:TDT family transporter [Xinfangfangia pollutisoli]|uniref:SLAC1 family transporter n=1 Tax=Xinfangfangia pollutisoli TaxID=2865960 RepID=UPI001CD50556|nr:tellurium resistance protein [Xinfangfangia pollutisoli]